MSFNKQYIVTEKWANVAVTVSVQHAHYTPCCNKLNATERPVCTIYLQQLFIQLELDLICIYRTIYHLTHKHHTVIRYQYGSYHSTVSIKRLPVSLHTGNGPTMSTATWLNGSDNSGRLCRGAGRHGAPLPIR